MTGAAASTPSGQQIARMERDLAALQTQVKSARKLTASTICILPSHADTLPSCSPTLASFGGFRITAQNVLGSFRKSLRSKRSALSRRPRRRKIPYGAETWPIGITKRSRLVRQDRIMYRLEQRTLAVLCGTSNIYAPLLRRERIVQQLVAQTPRAISVVKSLSRENRAEDWWAGRSMARAPHPR